MDSSLADFLFAVVNFLLLAAGLGWLALKPVRRAIDAERERHAKEEAAAEAARKDAEALAQRARASVDEAAHTAERARSDAVAAAARDAAAARARSEAEAAEARKRLDVELAARRRADLAERGAQMGEVAGAAVRELLEALGGPDLDAALVRGACRELAALAPARASSPPSPSSAAPPLSGVVVESARPLAAESRAALTAALGGGFVERVMPALGAGVRIVTPAGQVDASASAIARHAAQEVARHG